MENFHIKIFNFSQNCLSYWYKLQAEKKVLLKMRFILRLQSKCKRFNILQTIDTSSFVHHIN